jgi:folate-binding protein YgfZ
MKAALLDDRRVIRVSGPDAAHFLHNVVTGKIEGLEPGAAAYAALLAPQGKILADFLILATDDGFLIDTPATVAGDLIRRLKLYRLRAKAEIEEMPGLAVATYWDTTTPPAGAFADPRLAALGFRAFGPADAALPSGAVAATDWHAHRIALGVPEGGRDFAFGDAFPHEADMDRLGGVDFKKGCYIGQEVVSRMQHRATVRSRVVPVAIEGPAPAAGSEIRAGERPLGTMGSSAGDRGLAMLRLDRAAEAMAAGQPLQAGAATLTPHDPPWAAFGFAAATAGAAP